MATDIGPLTAKITASTEGLQKALDKSPAMIRTAADRMAKESKIAGEKAGQTAGASFVSKFGLAMLGGAAAGGVGAAGIAYLYSEGANAIREMGIAAAGAAMPVSEFQALAGAFAGNIGDATDAAVKLTTVLSNTVLGGADGSVFERLALEPTRLLASKNAIEELADSISLLPTGFAQVHASMSIFGEDYKKFLPVLQRGGEWIREQKSILDGFGAGITSGMVDSVQRADRMFAQISALWQGLKIQVTSGIAPLIAAITEVIPRLDKLGISFKGLGGWIIDGAEGIAKLGGGLVAAFTDPVVRGELFGLFGSVMEFAAQKLVQGVTYGIGSAMSALGKVPLGMGMSIDFGAGGDKLLAFANKLGGKAAHNLGVIETRWQDVIDALADNGLLARLDQFFGRARAIAGGAGVNAAALDQGAQVWLAAAGQMAKALESPADKFLEAIDKIEALQRGRPDALMLGAGGIAENALPWLDRIAIDAMRNPLEALFGNADLLTAGKAVQDLLGGLGSDSVQTTGAMLAGSREAYSTILANQLAGRETVQEKIERAIERGNQQRQRQIELGREALDAVRNIRMPAVRGIDG